MATIVTCFIVHERGCDGSVRGGVCSEGCNWQPLQVEAGFQPPPGSSVRERIQLARMAALFKVREIVNGRR